MTMPQDPEILAAVKTAVSDAIEGLKLTKNPVDVKHVRAVFDEVASTGKTNIKKILDAATDVEVAALIATLVSKGA